MRNNVKGHPEFDEPLSPYLPVALIFVVVIRTTFFVLRELTFYLFQNDVMGRLDG
jgi:hypothetical protein